MSFGQLWGDAVANSDVALRKPGQGWPLFVHLMLFGLALSLPVLAFAGLMLSQYNALERLRFEERLLDAAQEVAYELDQKLAGAISTAKALATSPALKEGNLEAFHQQAVAALASGDGVIVLLDKDGKQLVNTRVAWGTPLAIDANPRLEPIPQDHRPASARLTSRICSSVAEAVRRCSPSASPSRCRGSSPTRCA